MPELPVPPAPVPPEAERRSEADAGSAAGLVLRAGASLFFVPAERARRIARLGPITPVEGLVPPALGIARVEGEVLVVLVVADGRGGLGPSSARDSARPSPSVPPPRSSSPSVPPRSSSPSVPPPRSPVHSAPPPAPGARDSRPSLPPPRPSSPPRSDSVRPSASSSSLSGSTRAAPRVVVCELDGQSAALAGVTVEALGTFQRDAATGVRYGDLHAPELDLRGLLAQAEALAWAGRAASPPRAAERSRGFLEGKPK